MRSHFVRIEGLGCGQGHVDTEAGDTLVEVLVALVVIGLTAAALLGALATSLIASGEQRGLATTDTVLKSYVEAAIFQIENQPYGASGVNPIFAACGLASPAYYTAGIAHGTGSVGGAPLYTPPSLPSPGYSASIVQVQYWNGSSFVSSCSPGSLNPQQLTAIATAPNGTSSTLSFVVSNPHVPAGSASQVVIVTQPPSNATSGSPFTVGVVIEDSLGHVINSNASVRLGITTQTGTVGAALACSSNPVVASAGAASFSCSINFAGAGYTLSATSPGLSSATTNSVTVAPGAATHISFTPNPPSGGVAVAGSPIPAVSVDVLDAAGNVVTNASGGSIAMTIGSGSQFQPTFDAVSQTSVAVVNGVAIFANLQLTTPGSYTMVATPSGVTGVTSPVTSATISVSSASPPVLVFTTPPGGGPSGQVWSGQPAVAIEDGHGVVQTANTSAISLSILAQPGNASLDCSTFGTTIVPTNGVASFAGCSIVGTAGSTYQLIATAASGSGVASAVSPQFAINAGSAYALRIGRQPGGANSGLPLSPQPQIYVDDSGGNVVTSSTASVLAFLNVNGNSGATLACLPSSNVTSASSGVATFSGCNINKTGNNYTITFLSPGLLSASSNSVTIG